MGEARILYAIAESCPFDSVLVRDMKKSVNSLLQLNLKRFRVPQTNLAKYSALDIVKQALELLYEFSPSEKNYREAMRTLQAEAWAECLVSPCARETARADGPAGADAPSVGGCSPGATIQAIV